MYPRIFGYRARPENGGYQCPNDRYATILMRPDLDQDCATCIYFSHFEVSLLRRWLAEMKDGYQFTTDAQD